MRTTRVALVALAVCAVAAAFLAISARGTPRNVSGLDQEWLKSSAQGDIFEIRGGHMALAKSQNTAVRQLAQRLITDHSKSLSDARRLAAQFGIQLKLEPTQSQQWELWELNELSGNQFDHDYSQLEVQDHMQDIEETTSEVQEGSNPQIRHDARQEIPVLQLHLHLSRVALRSAGGDDDSGSGSGGD
jgi:putative membrane protein